MQPERRFWLSGPQTVVILVVLIGLLLTLEFNRRLDLNRRIGADEQTLAAEVATAEARQAMLLAERSYIQTDAYVERWARYEAKMVRPGEVLVVPVLEAPRPPAAATAVPAPPTPEPWQAWWALFFGP